MPKKEAVSAAPMRILKISTCPSLSGRSELTYHVGCNTEGEIHFRVVANSGSGQFNADAVPLQLIEKLLSEHPACKPMASTVLSTVFRHRSSNSPAFLFAVLKAELLVLPGKDRDSGYIMGDVVAFKQALSALIASDTHLDAANVISPETTKRKRSSKEAT